MSCWAAGQVPIPLSSSEIGARIFCSRTSGERLASVSTSEQNDGVFGVLRTQRELGKSRHGVNSPPGKLPNTSPSNPRETWIDQQRCPILQSRKQVQLENLRKLLSVTASRSSSQGLNLCPSTWKYPVFYMA